MMVKTELVSGDLYKWRYFKDYEVDVEFIRELDNGKVFEFRCLVDDKLLYFRTLVDIYQSPLNKLTS